MALHYSVWCNLFSLNSLLLWIDKADIEGKNTIDWLISNLWLLGNKNLVEPISCDNKKRWCWLLLRVNQSVRKFRRGHELWNKINDVVTQQRFLSWTFVIMSLRLYEKIGFVATSNRNQSYHLIERALTQSQIWPRWVWFALIFLDLTWNLWLLWNLASCNLFSHISLYRKISKQITF